MKMVVKRMKKIRIVACDNNPYDQKYYEDFIRCLGEKYCVDLEMKHYYDGEVLLFDLDEADFLQTIDVMQIEIDLPGKDGIQIAKSARKLGYSGLIVFLTHSDNRYEEAFDVKASNYIRKGAEHLPRLEKVFVDTIETVQKMRQEYIVLRCAGERKRINMTEIKFFEVMQHRMIVHYNESQLFEFVSSMGKLESELIGRGFIRIHRGYMVSLDYVKSYSYKNVILFDGEELPVGRTYYADFKKMIERWNK